MDASGAPEVESHCKNLIEENCEKILLNMNEVKYISSAGLRTLLVIAKTLKAKNGKLVLCSLSPMVSEVIEISGFSNIILQAENVDTAIKLF